MRTLRKDQVTADFAPRDRCLAQMDSGRRGAIVRLLETLNDGLPQPVRRVETAAGFVHGAWHREDCPDCAANGRRMAGCVTCGGRGWLERWLPRDPYATDRVAPYGLTGDRHEAARRRDAEIARLEAQTAAPRSEEDLLAGTRPDGWELARRRMYASFDYAALDWALELLRGCDEVAYHALHGVYVYGWQPCVSRGLEAACERGFRFLDERLPDPLRAPAPEPGLRVGVGPVRPEAGRRVKAARDLAMRDAAAAGATVSELCRRFGVSKSVVYQVVNQGSGA